MEYIPSNIFISNRIESIFKSYYNHELKAEKDTLIGEVQSFIDSAEYN